MSSTHWQRHVRSLQEQRRTSTNLESEAKHFLPQVSSVDCLSSSGTPRVLINESGSLSVKREAKWGRNSHIMIPWHDLHFLLISHFDSNSRTSGSFISPRPSLVILEDMFCSSLSCETSCRRKEGKVQSILFENKSSRDLDSHLFSFESHELQWLTWLSVEF